MLIYIGFNGVVHNLIDEKGNLRSVDEEQFERLAREKKFANLIFYNSKNYVKTWSKTFS